MITYDNILVLIGTILIFSQGFYFGRRQMLRVMIISLIMIFLSMIGIVLNGVYTLDEKMTMYKIIAAIIYVAFWWGLGFVMSHFVLIKEGDIGKVKRIKIDNKP